jgi:SAM-dependent methyltransferase
MAKTKLKAEKAPEIIKLDLGCGKNKREGFIGVDARQFDNKVDVICDLGKDAWPWKDESVDEVNASHFIEHLNGQQRIHFVNELYRVLRKDAKATIVTPHWASNRAYGDMTHQWPPVSEMWFYYLDKNWRKDNAPHNDFYTCDFACTWGYSLHPGIANRNQEFQQDALQFKKEAAQDMICTMVKR